MEFRILGRLEVEVDGRPLPVPGVKERILLTCLLLEANHPVPADRPLDALWPEGPPATADGALRVHISHLCRALDDHSQEHPRIEAVRPGYMIHVAPGELDASGAIPRHRRGSRREAKREAELHTV
jgi:DNA-binding SARP family transcriptional activator